VKEKITKKRVGKGKKKEVNEANKEK